MMKFVTVQCNACLRDFEGSQWDVNHGLSLCDDCTSDYAEARDDVFESALWEATR